ncbi:unnamed protein product, partial [Symbiodinium microadriaticum]
GEKWPQFADIWTELTADDVVGPEARQRYKLDNLRVALEDMRSDVVTDSFFDDTSLLKTSESFLFDAGYTFILAINSLLNKGNSLSDIKGELLLNEVRATVFTGIAGLGAEATHRMASAVLDRPTPSSSVALAFIRRYCLGGDATFSRCPRGTFANETGMSNCTDCAVGRFAAKVGSAECDECLPGSCGSCDSVRGSWRLLN